MILDTLDTGIKHSVECGLRLLDVYSAKLCKNRPPSVPLHVSCYLPPDYLATLRITVCKFKMFPHGNLFFVSTVEKFKILMGGNIK